GLVPAIHVCVAALARHKKAWMTGPSPAKGAWSCVEYADDSQRLGPRDDLDQLLRDHGLARAVVVEGEPVDHLAGIAGGVVHRGHARALLARRVLEKCRKYLHRQVLGQQFVEDLFLRRLKLVN